MTVSDTPTHLSSSVLAILHKFFDIGISEKENIKYEQYWTDSPTSQYRNRFILHTIANHIDMFGFKAIWNYFEAGHGKVMVKLAPDRAVNSGKHVKQDAEDFYNWAKQSTKQEVHFFYVSNDECDLEAERLQKQGRMTLHSVSLDKNILLVRDMLL